MQPRQDGGLLLSRKALPGLVACLLLIWSVTAQKV